MEEKKLTDDTEIDVGMIVKALECCKKNEVESTCAYCSECPASDWDCEEDITDCTVDLFQKAINLIHRLQSENTDLKNKNEELYYNGLNENTARLGDMQTIERLEDMVARQKAEIERLTEEGAQIGQSYIEVCDINAELQKQVDELKQELDKEYELRKNYMFSCEQKDPEIKYLEIELQQAVKDTAKEIYKELFEKQTEVYNEYVFKNDDYDDLETNAIINFSDSLSYEFEKFFKEKYGVEVK